MKIIYCFIYIIIFFTFVILKFSSNKRNDIKKQRTKDLIQGKSIYKYI